MQDKRLVNRLQTYWDGIRQGKPMPDFGQLNPGAIDDMWQQCMNLEAIKVQGGTNFFYRFMGDELVSMFGEDLTGQAANLKIARYPYGIVVGKLQRILESKSFLTDENQFVNEKSKIVKYRACFMPFGNESKGITNIVVGYSAREY